MYKQIFNNFILSQGLQNGGWGLDSLNQSVIISKKSQKLTYKEAMEIKRERPPKMVESLVSNINTKKICCNALFIEEFN